MRHSISLRAAAALTILLAGALQAQTTFGVIRGRVIDPSGATVPAVTVNVVNTGTNIAKTVVSNEAGLYEAGYLQPGTYSVTVEQAGFQKFLTADIVLNANATVLVDVALSVGALSSSVTVEGGAPLITTENATISDIKTGQQYADAPLGRFGYWDSFLFDYMVMVPGAQATTDNYTISFAGMRKTANNYTVDGITTNAPLWGNQVTPAIPSMDFIREVKADVSSNSAEFGSPGYVNVVTKGGENKLHASAYLYYATGGLRARSFFSSRSPFEVLHDYGVRVSGPMRKNKTFFSAAFEHMIDRAAKQLNINLPSMRVRGGDFSKLLGPKGAPLVIQDVTTGAPFPNAIIPTSRLNPVALKYQERFFTVPIMQPNYGDPESVVGNWRGQFKQGQSKRQVDLRIDHQINSKNSLFGRFNLDSMPKGVLDGELPTIGIRLQYRGTHNIVVSDTHTLRPNLLNEFRFGKVYELHRYTGPVMGPDLVKQLGFTNVPPNLPDIQAIPTINLTGYNRIWQYEYTRYNESIYQWQDNLTWIRGRHSLKAGLDIWRNWGANFATSPSSAYPTYSFTGQFTGYSYADFLLGIPFSASRAAGVSMDRIEYSNIDKFFFVQDEFKASSSLTLILGLRYELNPPYVEKGNHFYTFNPWSGNMIVPTPASKQQLNAGFLASNLVPIVTADQAGLPVRRLAFTDKNNFAPRLGLAYRLTSDNKTVLRSGYGLFYDSFTASLWSAAGGGPYVGTENAPPNAIVNGAALWQFPLMFPASPTQAGTAAMAGIDPHMRTPYIQQWSVTLERAVWNMGLRASYIGTKSQKLVMYRDLGQPVPSTIRYTAARRAMYPQLSRVNYRDNSGTAFYNGLVLVAERKMKNGLQYQISHTWAKNLTNAHSDGETGSGMQNIYDRRSEWADYAYTRRHRFMANAYYELPVRPRGSGSAILRQITGGWAISLYGVAETGPYYTPSFSGSDPANVGVSGGRPDCIGNPNVSNPTIAKWFNASAFAAPPAGRFGNCGLNVLGAPGNWLVNSRITKNFTAGESIRGSLQASFTNVLNHPNFGTPYADISLASAGIIQSAGAGRATTLALRFEF